MEIIESYIEGKEINHCDDGLFINDNFIAIIDGVTSKGKFLWDGKKSGEFAKDVICRELEKLDKEIDAYSAIKQINESIKNSYGDRYLIAEKQVEEKIAATIVIFSNFRKEVWIFGDCQCLVNGNHYNDPKKMDRILAEVRSLYINIELLKGKTKEEISQNDPGREYILPLIREGGRYANKTDTWYRYNVLDGFEIDEKRSVIIKVNSEDEIVLASDGYPVLKSTLKESEEILKRILEEDPLFIELHKSTKGLAKGNQSFDDRTYIRFIV